MNGREEPTATVGWSLPDFVRALTAVDLMAYGAATWDWHRLHHDTPYAMGVGMRGPVVDGQMFGALLAQQVLDAFGSDAAIERVHFRNRAPVHAGDEVRLTARIVERHGDRLVIEQQALVDDRIVVAPAGVQVVLPERGA